MTRCAPRNVGRCRRERWSSVIGDPSVASECRSRVQRFNGRVATAADSGHDEQHKHSVLHGQQASRAARILVNRAGVLTFVVVRECIATCGSLSFAWRWRQQCSRLLVVRCPCRLLRTRATRTRHGRGVVHIGACEVPITSELTFAPSTRIVGTSAASGLRILDPASVVVLCDSESGVEDLTVISETHRTGVLLRDGSGGCAVRRVTMRVDRGVGIGVLRAASAEFESIRVNGSVTATNSSSIPPRFTAPTQRSTAWRLYSRAPPQHRSRLPMSRPPDSRAQG